MPAVFNVSVMASVVYKLSRREMAGKHQIILWLKVNSGLQPQIKTNVWVSTEHFETTSNNGGNAVGYIKVPKRSHLNFVAVKEATEAKQKVEELASKLLMFCTVIPQKELTKENILLAADGVMNAGIEVSWEELQAYRLSKDKPVYGFFECFEQFVRENDIAGQTEKNARVVMRTMRRWERYTDRCIKIDTLSADDLCDFREYMKNEYLLQKENPKLFMALLNDFPLEGTPKHKTQTIQPRGNNTLVAAMKKLRRYWRWLVYVKHYTSNDPFRDIVIGTEKYGTPYYLTIDERNTIAEHDFGMDVSTATMRDIFVFQCLIGCRVSDLIKLTADNIHEGVLEYVPHKTKDGTKAVKVRVPLSQKAQELIKKYESVDQKGRLFPFCSTDKYSKAIKHICKECGIDRAVPVRNSVTEEIEMKPLWEVASSHMARRTFVGNAYAKVKDPNLISKMSGHVEGSKAFARYRNIEDEALREVIDLIE